MSSSPCASKASSSATKIPRKILAERCLAVLTEPIFVKTRKRAQRILCVLSSPLTRNWRKLARQNRVRIGAIRLSGGGPGEAARPGAAPKTQRRRGSLRRAACFYFLNITYRQPQRHKNLRIFSRFEKKARKRRNKHKNARICTTPQGPTPRRPAVGSAPRYVRPP